MRIQKFIVLLYFMISSLIAEPISLQGEWEIQMGDAISAPPQPDWQKVNQFPIHSKLLNTLPDGEFIGFTGRYIFDLPEDYLSRNQETLSLFLPYVSNINTQISNQKSG